MAASIRLYIPAPLLAGTHVHASAGQAHFLRNVMRRAAGDCVSVFNGADGEWIARIQALPRNSGLLVVTERLRPQAPEPDLWLLFAPLKRDATDLVVQKATELGAAALIPVLTERTNPARVNLERLTIIAVEAAEQCERLTVPRIRPPRPLQKALEDWPAERPLLVAMERVDAPPLPAIAGPAALLIGPEGGFTPAELDALRRHPFVHPASLGPRILRAETAALAGLALLQAHSGG